MEGRLPGKDRAVRGPVSAGPWRCGDDIHRVCLAPGRSGVQRSPSSPSSRACVHRRRHLRASPARNCAGTKIAQRRPGDHPQEPWRPPCRRSPAAWAENMADTEILAALAVRGAFHRRRHPSCERKGTAGTPAMKRVPVRSRLEGHPNATASARTSAATPSRPSSSRTRAAPFPCSPTAWGTGSRPASCR